MTIYDVAMVGIVVAGMVWGAWRGITWQLASIASLVLAVVVAFLWPDTFTSNAVLRITPSQVSDRIVLPARGLPRILGRGVSSHAVAESRRYG